MVDKTSAKIICTAFSNDKRHDFRVFKEVGVRFQCKTKVLTDTGYQGLQKLHANSELPKKRRKNDLLTNEDKQQNSNIASQRVLNENVIGMLKRLKIIADQ